MISDELTGIYYTSNWLDKHNPFFLQKTKEYLVKALGDIPLIVVSHKPVPKESFVGYKGDYTNLVAGKDYELYSKGRSHLNIYWQMLVGVKNAKTKYVANIEDDIAYTFEHFHNKEAEKEFTKQGDIFLYDMSKVSLFTWNKVPMFSFRSKRKVINQLIAPKNLFIEAMEERFERVKYLLANGKNEEQIIRFFAEFGRYENHLGVKVQPTFEIYCDNPSVVLSHPLAFGYLTQGKRKKLGDIKIIELYSWGRADKMLNEIWGKAPRE